MTDRLKKAICIMCAALLCVPAAVVSVHADDSEERNADFDALLQQDFINTMEQDYLTMHFTVKDPDSLGIVKPAVQVGRDPRTELSEARCEAEDMLAKLRAFDYDSLSTTQQHDYDALVYAYEDQLNRSDENYSWLFTPGNNLVTNLSTNLTEFIFYTRSDFDDYITLLQSVPSYLQACLSFTEEQAEAGYFMSDKALEETGLDYPDIDCIAAAKGPGSYTGLRIGVGAVKGICMGAPHIKAAGVSTLMALAYNVSAYEGKIAAVMRARPKIIYGAVFECKGGRITRVTEDKVCGEEEFFSQDFFTGRIMLVGDCAYEIKAARFADNDEVITAPANAVLQRASSLCMAVNDNTELLCEADVLEVSYLQATKAEKDKAHRDIP